ncbi:MAG TPA: alpha/beta hydrolase [Arachidicoccus sp.]|nr:alpha/beta hydrolase [Arachidicoccus sp.]
MGRQVGSVCVGAQNQQCTVFYIHGGGWTHGKKEDEYEKVKVFIEAGFTVANVEYRLAGQAPAPAADEDVHCALVYLLNRAKQYNINPEKVILIGASAGGHLALLLGLRSVNPLFDGGCKYPNLIIAGIISKYGPTDLMTWKPARQVGSSSSTWLGARLMDTAFIKTLSPVNYVSPKIRQIPVLFVHGKKDMTVPIRQAEVLYQKLKANGNKTKLFIAENGKHGNFSPADNVQMNKVMIDFILQSVASESRQVSN